MVVAVFVCEVQLLKETEIALGKLLLLLILIEKSLQVLGKNLKL